MEHGLSLSGLIFVILAWGSILVTTIFCFWRVLTTRKKSK